MSSPFEDGDWNERPDWPLAQDGAVSLFYKTPVLEAAVDDLKALDYHFINLDCRSIKAFTASVSAGFRWRDQFGYDLSGPNLDAINDGLRAPPFGTSKRLAIVAKCFDKLHAADAYLATTFLDIPEHQSRNALLFGNLMLGLIQTDDPRFLTGDLGGRPARFNQQEWLDSSRGI